MTITMFVGTTIKAAKARRAIKGFERSALALNCCGALHVLLTSPPSADFIIWLCGYVHRDWAYADLMSELDRLSGSIKTERIE